MSFLVVHCPSHTFGTFLAGVENSVAVDMQTGFNDVGDKFEVYVNGVGHDVMSLYR